MLIRKSAATASLVLGLLLLSFSAPTLAGAAVDGAVAGDQQLDATQVLAAADAPQPTGVPVDPPITPEPTTPTGTVPTIPVPTVSVPTPSDPTPSDPGPTDPPVIVPTRPPSAPDRDLAPGNQLQPAPKGSGKAGSGNRGRGLVSDDSDEGTTDPGADESAEQGELPAEDPALGDADQVVSPQAAAAPSPETAGALPDTGADGSLTWMALLGAGLTVVGGMLLKRPRLARHRA